MSNLLDLYEHAPAATSPDPVNLRETLIPMLDGLSRALGYDRALVALFDQRRGSLRGTVGLNVPEPLAESLDVPLGQANNPIVRAVLEGTPQRIELGDTNGTAALDENTRALLLELGMTSLVVAPLRSGISEFGPPPMWQGREISSQGVVLLSKEHRVTDEDIEWLMPFANQAGVALARATDVELLRGSTEQASIENEWLWWMINAVDDPVLVVDKENSIVHQNHSAEKFFRAGGEDSEAKRHAIRMNNFLFTAAVSAWNLEQGDDPSHQVANTELTLVDPIEGTDLYFDVLTTPMMHYRLNERGLVTVLKNVTDLRRATEQLSQNVQQLQQADEEIRLERDRLDQILRSVPSPIVVIDVVESVNQIVRMNREASRLFQPGVPSSGVVNTNAVTTRSAQVALSNDAKFTSFLAQLRLDPAQIKSGELMLADPDNGEELPMWVTCTEIRDELGSVTGMVAIMNDLSELKELERRRIEQALFESEKLAAQGRMAAQIAHEINNPLEALKNALYLVANNVPEADTNYRFLQIALKETQRVSRILQHMLGFYKPTASMTYTDLNAVIEEAEALVGNTLKQRGVRVQNDLASDLPPVMCSGDQIKQVLLNMLINASHETVMPGGGMIYLSTHVSHDADPEFLRSGAVHIQVRDTGVGIPEENMSHIFEPFFSTKQEKGTGLGLWVSNGIVRSHGGDIKVRSRPGRGTTFTITLPIEGPPPDAATV
ncbi:MAG TPA: ATP-binding protein [Chloroflexota bacterium]|nr:ATP-binding protein [Chloroflexota bacterium]